MGRGRVTDSTVEVEVWVGLQSMPSNSTRMPSLADIVVSLRNWSDPVDLRFWHDVGLRRRLLRWHAVGSGSWSLGT